MHLSATRIRTYLTCPRKYRYAYIDDIPVVPTGPVAFGRVMHQTLYSLHQQSMNEGRHLNVEDGFATFDRLWRETLQQEQPLFKQGDGAQQSHRLTLETNALLL